MNNIIELKEKAMMIEKGLSNEIESISDFIFNNPEVSEQEFVSSKFLVDILENYGFDVEYPYLGLPTAFKASFGKESDPAIAFLAEYDALPGYSENGEPAHACGHNWIAASTVGAAIVLSQLKESVPGRIVVIGCPAEETVGSKVNLIEGGAFNDIDIAMQIHLDALSLVQVVCLAMDAWEFSFEGKAAHAASCPYDGVNALDAVNLTFCGINALRQHVRSDVRIHGIVTNGGQAPNIVPEKASCRFYARALKRKYLNEVSEKVINCAKGAALMTGAKLNIKRFENPFDDMNSNKHFNNLVKENFGVTKVENIVDEDPYPASSDVGNVSYVVPTAYSYIGDGLDFSVHELNFVDYANSKEAKRLLHKAVQTLAFSAIDALQPDNLSAIKEEFERSKI